MNKQHNLSSNQPGQFTYRHSVTVSGGSILPQNQNGTFDVIEESCDPNYWPSPKAEMVRVRVGPGYADYRLADMYVSQLVAEPAYGPLLATTRHTGVKPVDFQNPFSGAWDAVATPFAKRIDAAIDRV